MNEYVIPIATTIIPILAFGWCAKYFVQKEDYKEDKIEIKDSIKKLEGKIDDHASKIIDLLTK